MKNRNLPRQLPSAEANFEGCNNSNSSVLKSSQMT